MKRYLVEFYVKQQFHPSPFAALMNPFYFARRSLVKAMHKYAHHLTGKVLDIGCGSKPYAELIQASEYVGVEMDTAENRKQKKADFFYDGKTLPFPDRSFDSILINQVLEHVFEPHQFLREMNRVLKVGGVLLLTVPFCWDEHEQPFDYARYSSFGLQYLIKMNHFEILQTEKCTKGGIAILQLWIGLLYKKLSGKNNFWNIFVTLIFLAPLNVLGLISSPILPSSDDIYLDNVIVAKKITP